MKGISHRHSSVCLHSIKGTELERARNESACSCYANTAHLDLHERLSLHAVAVVVLHDVLQEGDGRHSTHESVESDNDLKVAGRSTQAHSTHGHSLSQAEASKGRTANKPSTNIPANSCHAPQGRCSTGCMQPCPSCGAGRCLPSPCGPWCSVNSRLWGSCAAAGAVSSTRGSQGWLNDVKCG